MTVEVKAFRKAFYKGSLVRENEKVEVDREEDAKSWGVPVSESAEAEAAEQPAQTEEQPAPAPKAKRGSKAAKNLV